MKAALDNEKIKDLLWILVCVLLIKLIVGNLNFTQLYEINRYKGQKMISDALVLFIILIIMFIRIWNLFKKYWQNHPQNKPNINTHHL